MADQILIVDDDADFNALLTDIFSHGTYEVSSFLDPMEALPSIEAGKFALVVTDHRMPNLTGTEFFDRIRAVDPKVPVVVVSGYLDNKSIRRLINYGIAGVFIKPLNVFSLMKRAGELIAKSRSETDEDESPEAGRRKDQHGDLPFEFRSYPCVSPKTLAFAKKLHAQAEFGNYLLLVGPDGIPIEEIARDLTRMNPDRKEALLQWEQAPDPEEEMLDRFVHLSRQGIKDILYFVPELEEITPQEEKAIFNACKKAGVFSATTTRVRFVFHARGDVDTLYDANKISDALYIALGTVEIVVPTLNDCREDIVPFVERFIAQAHGSHSDEEPLELAPDAAEKLRSHSWLGDVAELRDLCSRLPGFAREGRISKSGVEAALLGFRPRGSGPLGAASPLRDELREGRASLFAAAWLLSGNNVDFAAETLRVPRDDFEMTWLTDRGSMLVK